MQKSATTLSLCLVICLLLAACTLPGTTLTTPIATDPAPLALQPTLPPTIAALTPTRTVLTATHTSPPPTSTKIPPTAADIASTPTTAVGPAVMLDRIFMTSAAGGWGWSPSEQHSLLVRTIDGGQTWRDVSPSGDHAYLDGFFLDENTAWLTFYDFSTQQGGMLHTIDGGLTWIDLPANPDLQNAFLRFSNPTDGIAEVAGLGAGNAYIRYFQTLDGGLSWSVVPLASPKPDTSLPPGTIHLCNICSDTLYFDTNRAVIIQGSMANDPTGSVQISVSQDLGQTWKEIALPLPEQYADGSVLPNPPAFFGDNGLLPVNVIQYNQDGTLKFSVLLMYSTQDGGQNWQASNGILQGEQQYFDRVQILSAREAFVRCSGNLCVTNDGGQNWRELPQSLNFDQAAGGPDYVTQYLFIDPATGWAISGESGATMLWKTSDGGSTWTKLNPTIIP